MTWTLLLFITVSPVNPPVEINEVNNFLRLESCEEMGEALLNYYKERGYEMTYICQEEARI